MNGRDTRAASLDWLVAWCFVAFALFGWGPMRSFRVDKKAKRFVLGSGLVLSFMD